MLRDLAGGESGATGWQRSLWQLLASSLGSNHGGITAKERSLLPGDATVQRYRSIQRSGMSLHA